MPLVVDDEEVQYVGNLIILMHSFIACTSSIKRDILLFSYSIQNDQYQGFL